MPYKNCGESLEIEGTAEQGHSEEDVEPPPLASSWVNSLAVVFLLTLFQYLGQTKIQLITET